MPLATVTEIRPGVMDQHGTIGGGNPPTTGGPGDGMEARIAKLESDVSHIETSLTDIKTDIRELRNCAKDDFRVLFGAIIVATLGLATLLAKGFQWF